MGGSNPSTTTVSNQAPSWALPYLKQITGEAGKLYDAGTGSGVWQGPNIAPQSGATIAGQDALRAAANNNWALPAGQQALGTAQNIAGGALGTGTGNEALNKWLNVSPDKTAPQWGGLYGDAGTMNAQNLQQLRNVGQNPITTEGLYKNVIGDAQTQNNKIVNPVLGGIASGRNEIETGDEYGALGRTAVTQNDPYRNRLGAMGASGGITTADDFGRVAQGAGGATSADQFLEEMRSGGLLGKNPYIDAIANANAERIKNQMGSAMSGRGRYGSFGHGDALTRSITEANNPLYAQAYESDMNRILAATGQTDAARQGARGQQLGALQGQTGAEAGGFGNKLQATLGAAGINTSDLAQALQALGGRTGVEGQNIGNALQASGLLGNLNLAGNAQELGAVQGLTGAQGMEAGLRTDAASRAAGINEGDLGLQAGILGQLGDTQMNNAQFQTGVANQSAANARADTGMQLQANQQAAAMLPFLNQLGLQPAQLLSMLGAQQDQYANANLAGDRARFYEQQNLPWAQLDKFLSPVRAAMGGQGNQNSTTTPPGFGLQQGLGLGIAGIPALFGSSFGGQSAAAGLGSALGGLGGILGPFMGGLL